MAELVCELEIGGKGKKSNFASHLNYNPAIPLKVEHQVGFDVGGQEYHGASKIYPIVKVNYRCREDRRDHGLEKFVHSLLLNLLEFCFSHRRVGNSNKTIESRSSLDVILPPRMILFAVFPVGRTLQERVFHIAKEYFL